VTTSALPSAVIASRTNDAAFWLGRPLTVVNSSPESSPDVPSEPGMFALRLLARYPTEVKLS
jgi:hypothetical protein